MGPTNIETPAEGFFKIHQAGTMIVNLINAALVGAAILCLAFIIWGGIDWVMSGGDKAKYEEARNKITAALIGLAVTALAWLLWRLAIYFLGIGQTTDGQIIFRFGFD